MTKIQSLDETYKQCESGGFFRPKEEIDKDLAESLLKSALEGIDRLKMSGNEYEKKTRNYSFIFTEKYDILRRLFDAFLICYKVSSSNHQCCNAYICFRHKELELDWNTLESMRLIRNNINYKGIAVGEDVWKSYRLKFDVYISTMIKAAQGIISGR